MTSGPVIRTRPERIRELESIIANLNNAASYKRRLGLDIQLRRLKERERRRIAHLQERLRKGVEKPQDSA